MKRWLYVCLVALAPSGLAQTTDWQTAMTQAYASERAGNYAEAAAGYRSALRIVEQSSPGDAHLPNILRALGSAFIGMGDFTAAESYYRRAISLVEATAGKKNADYSLLLRNLANLYSAEGRQAKAETMLRAALGIDSGLFGADDARTGTAAISLALTLFARGNYQEAETLLLGVIPVLEGQPPANAEFLPIAFNDLGTLRLHQGRVQEAETLYEQSLAGLEANLGPAHPLLLRPLNNLAQTYAALGRVQEAEAIFRRAVSIAETRLKTNPDYPALLANFAAFLRKMGRKAEAKTVERNSQQALREFARDHGVGMTVDVSAFKLK